MRKRILGVLTAVCCIAQLAAICPASAADLVDAGLNYTESTDFIVSSDSGYSSGIWISAAPGKDWSSTNVTGFSLLLIGIGNYSSGMNADGRDYDLDEVFFTSLEAVLQRARSNNATVGLRFRYDDKGAQNPEPATFDQVLRHIEQIGESGLLDKYEEVISFVETGLVGSWGEQWGGKYTSLEHKAQVLDAFLNITPDTIPVTIRTPNTMRQWLKDYCGITTTPEDMSYSISDPELAAKADRIGMYNDGYMGSDSDLGTYSNRVGETAWLHNAPSYGGEFSGSDAWRLRYTTWQPEYALPEMYHTNLLRINCNIWKDRTDKASFDTREEAQAKLDEIAALYTDSGLGYFDHAGTITEENGQYTASWKWMGYDDFTFDRTLDDKLGVDCDNSAFYGQNVWQFIRAHLGYRFVLRASRLTDAAAPGDTMKMEFAVENTGFSEAPKDKEVEVLLSNGTITYTLTTDLNARSWASASYNKESLELTLPKTMPGGDWDVYLRISDVNADAIHDRDYAVRFANADAVYSTELSANYMGSIRISGTQDAQVQSAKDKRPAGYYMHAQPVSVDEKTPVNLLDQSYTFQEDGHYGFTVLYKIDGVKSEIQLGDWYASWNIPPTGYASAYTTYGLNIRNQKISEDGIYAMHVPFYSAAFNCTDPASAGSRLTSFAFNDTRNTWSADTYTLLNGNTGVTVTPLAVIEGGYEEYSVTYHLPDSDVTYTGTYGFQDTKHQTITHVPAVTALSLLETAPAESYTQDGKTYKLLGYTTREGDKSCLIDENFAAMGNVELYPFYELDKTATNLNGTVSVLTNGADAQGVRYQLNDASMTASVGDGSRWEGNAGAGSSSLVIPAYVENGGKVYTVTSVSDNAFGSRTDIADIFIPGTVSSIGTNIAYKDTILYFYEGSAAGKTAQAAGENPVVFIPYSTLMGDVNMDGSVSVADVVALQRWLLMQPVPAFDSAAANMVEDDIINVLDLAKLKRHLLA